MRLQRKRHQMARLIGYYVHHHGDGHRQRALALAQCSPSRIVMLGTGLAGRTNKLPFIDLPDDRMAGGAFDGFDDTSSRPQALHYAPLDHPGVRSRMGLIARWIAEARPALMIVDVSVEVAMLARLCATPVAFVRLSGHRNDVAHLEAYRAASLLIAPFAQQLDDLTIVEWIRYKTAYCPGILSPQAQFTGPAERQILIVAGRGGRPLEGALVAAAAAATPTYRWRVIGPVTQPGQWPSNVTYAGWVDNALKEISASEIVIGAAGDGLISAVIAARRPLICCPEHRPYEEQVQKAQALKKVGAAVVVDRWPQPDKWDALFAEARRLDPRRLAALGDPEGAPKAMRLIERLADRQ
jgi:Glycosyltransferase family 28 C-terminal domain